jgi:hypothetical protein
LSGLLVISQHSGLLKGKYKIHCGCFKCENSKLTVSTSAEHLKAWTEIKELRNGIAVLKMTTRAEDAEFICLDNQKMKSAVSAPTAFSSLRYSI